MKKNLIWIGLLIVGATLQQCKNDGADPAALQKVQFRFGLPASAPSGGRTQSSLPTALLLSLEDGSGTPVYTFKKINLLQLGSDMITEPTQLSPGTYTITDFLLVDNDDAVLYATPKTGTPLADLVIHPLPYSFTVTADDVSIIEMQVIDTSQSGPEDFGYVSFNIHPVNLLSIAVFTNAGNELALTNADATLTLIESPFHDIEIVDNYVLEAKTNLITFVGEPAASYRLTVSKPGFKTYEKNFVYTDLLDSLNGAPFQIVLQQFSIRIKVTNTDVPLRFILQGFAGASIDVHWGDDTSDHFDFEGGIFEYAEFLHQYSTAQRYEMTVTGNIESITSFVIDYYQPELEVINLKALTNLGEFNSVHAPGPVTIDLSQNNMLTVVAISDNLRLAHLILPPPNHMVFSRQVTHVSIAGDTGLSTAEVDAIVDLLYYNATVWFIQQGSFHYDKNSEFPSGEMIGPPSPARLEKLRELKADFGWSIQPDPLP
ncbi:MAG TPA: hypothetical protein VIU12_16970 [Chryseolinea sp.]